jgi:hypothetical protein
VDLTVVQLKAAIRRLLDSKGVRGRVLDKVNRYGEIVIGVILERPAPPPHVTHAALPPEDPRDRPQRDPDGRTQKPSSARSAAHEKRYRKLREELRRSEAIPVDDVLGAGERIAPLAARDR